MTSRTALSPELEYLIKSQTETSTSVQNSHIAQSKNLAKSLKIDRKLIIIRNEYIVVLITNEAPTIRAIFANYQHI